jgi:hypothetical protein
VFDVKPRSVVEGILGWGRVRLAVTTLSPPRSAAIRVLGVLATPLHRGSKISLERRRDPRPEKPRAGDRPRPEPLADLVGCLDHTPPTVVAELE